MIVSLVNKTNNLITSLDAFHGRRNSDAMFCYTYRCAILGHILYGLINQSYLLQINKDFKSNV